LLVETYQGDPSKAAQKNCIRKEVLMMQEFFKIVKDVVAGALPFLRLADFVRWKISNSHEYTMSE
jgi:hypothetical protein